MIPCREHKVERCLTCFAHVPGSAAAPDEWQSVDTAPDGVVVETKIDDAQGVRNVQPLKRQGRLWFVPDGAMYVYYTPTHWRPAPAAAPSGPGLRGTLDELCEEIDERYDAFPEGEPAAWAYAWCAQAIRAALAAHPEAPAHTHTGPMSSYPDCEICKSLPAQRTREQVIEECAKAICVYCDEGIPLDKNDRHTGGHHKGTHCYAKLMRDAVRLRALSAEASQGEK